MRFKYYKKKKKNKYYSWAWWYLRNLQLGVSITFLSHSHVYFFTWDGVTSVNMDVTNYPRPKLNTGLANLFK